MSVPTPLAIDGAVVLDLATRSATVMPAEPGHPASLWRNGIEKLTRAESARTPMERSAYGASTVWAHVPGRREVARGVPEGGTLKFTFRKGDPAWAELVGTPRLSAIVVLDRAANQILSVKFRQAV